ncbi:hypothetical protein M0208_16420 [Sphingomonas sp. SUN019]|uniref:hypothetical protein n=1 Tax=Sphingomonas sp. SUN019 TaxID=2937788 RepID=UPI002164E824|nr:hypothetical protein [Sphingomonas sp. SUN019]UVO52018.1 hypothetical protein M0208_16420 [Sphingomonas sp. SUN019]
MTIFSDKLSRLHETITLVSGCGNGELAHALQEGRDRTVIGVGSGGSAVAAEFLARCRATLGFERTVVMTPMELVLSGESCRGCEIWLFSAGADNPDVAAAYRTATQSGAVAVRLVTVSQSGATAVAAAASAKSCLYVLPVADPKDGFLATHSMTAMITALLLACDALCERPSGNSLVDAFAQTARELLAPDSIAANAMLGFRTGDTLLLLCDPRVRTIAVLVETSLWETGIAPVQRTDFRNFAHGRHVWAAKYPDQMFILALTAAESRAVWRPIAEALPTGLRAGEVDFGAAGRFRCAVGVLQGLHIVRSLGDAAGIDPGKPGRGEFAKAIYDDASLDRLSMELSGAARHKLKAREAHDPLDDEGACVCMTARERIERLREARFRGVVLDYDGTIVTTQARLERPDPLLIEELVRLVDGGMILGIATGRGGSVGDMLREALPERVHASVTVGYYNGGHLRMLDVNIDEDQPRQDADILGVADWIEAEGLLSAGRSVKRGRVQLALNQAHLAEPARFAERIRACPEVADGRVKVLRSHHSFDLVPQRSSKLAVVKAVVARAGDPSAKVIGIGDSGSPLGNDHELLSGAYGISVDSVCGSLNGCWTFFGDTLTGPAAVSTMLQAMRVEDSHGTFDIDRINSTDENIIGT